MGRLTAFSTHVQSRLFPNCRKTHPGKQEALYKQVTVPIETPRGDCFKWNKESPREGLDVSTD